MADIIQSPPCTLHPAYSPIVWVLREFTVGNRLAPALSVVFTIDGQVQPGIFLTPVEANDAPPEYFFEVDAQEIIQSYFNNTDTLPTPGQDTHLYGFVATVQATATVYKDEGDGKLVEQATGQVTTGEVQVINAYRRGQELTCLDAYTQGVYTNTPGERPWLTRLQNYVELCRNSNFYLAAHNGTQPLIWTVRTFDTDGNQLQAGAFSNGMVSAGEVEIVGTGPINLNKIASWLGDQVMIDDAVDHYIISTGYLSLEDEVNINVDFRVQLTSKCCEYELVFLNSFGVYESMPIPEEDVLAYDVDGDTFTSARLLPSEANYLLSRGETYLEKTAVNSMQFSLPYTRDVYRDWHRDMLNSPDVYLLISRTGNYIPVNVDTGRYVIKNNFSELLTVTWANKDTSQRN